MLEGLRVLIVEDNKLNQKIAAFALEKLGAASHAVFNGREAIEELGNQKYDAILMDVQMPEMDGIEATLYIRKEMKLNIPIIGLTANNLFGEEENCIEAGMDACVSKPFNSEQLSQLILQLIKNQ